MRIARGGPLASARKTSGKGKTSGAGGLFSLGMSSQTSSISAKTAVTASSSIGDIAAILAVQAAGDEAQHGKAAIRHGFRTLDILDDLKLDVLSGRVSVARLNSLAGVVERERAEISDPVLGNLLDHIELRARVELAKFEKTSKKA